MTRAVVFLTVALAAASLGLFAQDASPIPQVLPALHRHRQAHRTPVLLASKTQDHRPEPLFREGAKQLHKLRSQPSLLARQSHHVTVHSKVKVRRRTMRLLPMGVAADFHHTPASWSDRFRFARCRPFCPALNICRS